MKYLLLCLMLVGCNIYNPDILEDCPEVLAWYPECPDQCGYTAQSLPDPNQCNYLLNWSTNHCWTTQERICAMGVRVTQHVDPVGEFCTMKIVTQDGCIAHFDGPLKVR